jgi:hypothetical protein
MRIRKLLGEALLPLVLLGGALFAIYGWMAPGRNSGSPIVITQGVVDDRVTEYQAWSGTPPSAPDLSGPIERYVPVWAVPALSGSRVWRPTALGRSSAPG